MNKPKKQHIISKVYLSYFKTNTESTEEKVVIIDTKCKYEIKPKSVPLNSAFFKKYEYYNSDDFVEEGYGLEVYLGKIENEYHKIMSNIHNKVNLDKSIRLKLLEFLVSAKLRSPIWRGEEYKHRLKMHTFLLNYNNADFNDNEEELKKKHLSKWLDIKKYNDLLIIFLIKRWYIYESKSEHSFITSDNPGYSIAWNEKMKIPDPYWDNLEYDSDGVIFFPLSSKYCLVIGPFESGTDININALDVSIEYMQAENELINFINFNTFATRDKLIISDSKLYFEKLYFEK
jgi:Protein of unknown function (DUF4238)